ncbi:twin-arginine translocation signal domain-containing protein [Bradyrhizobium sp. 170]|nr:twin-arginine translocation signal domain-containing protein [Bradyrhizobium sp. 170]
MGTNAERVRTFHRCKNCGDGPHSAAARRRRRERREFIRLLGSAAAALGLGSVLIGCVSTNRVIRFTH